MSELWRKKPTPKLGRGDGRIYGLAGVVKKWTIISHLQHTGNIFLQTRPRTSVPQRFSRRVLQQSEPVWEETQVKIFVRNLQCGIWCILTLCPSESRFYKSLGELKSLGDVPEPTDSVGFQVEFIRFLPRYAIGCLI